MKKPTGGKWFPELRRTKGPLYLALVDAIASDIQCGTLNVSERLPPQRELAKRLRVNYTTVSRAYREAQRRGLVYSRVGQGTFVCRPRVSQLSLARGDSVVDMTMNLPPEPDDPVLLDRLENSLSRVAARLRPLLRYEEFGGSPDARSAAQCWLSRVSITAELDCLLVCPGAQSALLAIVSLHAKPGDVVVCEAITYPGIRALATQFGIRLVGLPSDEQGICNDAFARACVELHPKLLYCNPTLQNPTTVTVSAARRRELIRTARAHGVIILEDDAYAFLPSSRPEPFVRLAPDITYYVSGFAKCLGAGLRVAYLLAPDARRAARLASIMRATAVMASPITVAFATECIENGTAEAVLDAIRAESVARQQIAREALAGMSYLADPEGFHVWLSLTAPWSRGSLSMQMRRRNVFAVASDAFRVSGQPPEAVRLCLGGTLSREELRHALGLFADAMSPPRSTDPTTQ